MTDTSEHNIIREANQHLEKRERKQKKGHKGKSE